MGPPPARSERGDREEGPLGTVRANTWASLGALVGLWLVLGFVVFLIFAFATQSITIGLLGGVLGGLAAAGALGYKLGFVDRVDTARRGAPLWVRLVLPLPVFLLLWFLFLVALGALITDFVLMVLAVTLLALVATGAMVWLLGLWADVPDRIRGSSPVGRFIGLAVVSLLTGLLLFLVGLMLVQEAFVAVALLLPGMVLGAVVMAMVTGWGKDAKRAVRGTHWGYRVAGFVLLLILLTFYFALLVGPFIPLAVFAYAVAAAIALALLIPLSMWLATWRDLWTDFTELGEDHRVVAVLPIFPIAAVLTFLLIVVLTSLFEVAYVVSIPVGIAVFLLAGLPFGVTQDIPRVVREQSLPWRALILLVTFAAITAYVYFGVALFLQLVEVSLLIGMATAALVVGLLIWRLDLGRGMGEEFESYGAPAEAAVLGAVFLGTLAVSFVLLALATGGFRLAVMVSVLVAAGVNYVVAHTTGMVEGMREAVAELPWWAELVVLAGIFLLALVYGMLALGVFYSNVPVALAFGAVLGLASVYALSRDLRLGDDVLVTADDRRNARVVLMTLTFLGGFLIGLYVSAAALQVAGSDLFGFPFFIALITGTGALLWVARTRGWGSTAVQRVRTTRDRVKVLGVVALWLGLGILTGFALQSVPLSGEAIGLGDNPRLPLSLTLAVGLVLWVWLPVLLFRVVAVEQPPVKATLSMDEKPKFLASLAWGVLAFLVTAVLLLTVLDDPVIGFAGAIVVGYLVALAMTTLRGRKGKEQAVGDEG